MDAAATKDGGSGSGRTSESREGDHQTGSDKTSQPKSSGGWGFCLTIRCTLPSCRCECFSPGKGHVRTCDSCKHGWVAHALDKLGSARALYGSVSGVELVQPTVVFDIASLMLYGSQATPIRLKILLDRLFSVLQHEEVLHVLHGFGWTYEDYARGYILQESSGRVLDKWTLVSREEEQIILQQFLRFGETKSIAHEIIMSDTREFRNAQLSALGAQLGQQPPQTTSTKNSESPMKKYVDRTTLGMQSYLRSFSEAASRFYSTYPTSSTGSRDPATSLPVTSLTLTSPGSTRSSNDQCSVSHTTSPLTRLQGMQPYDYRTRSVSPAPQSPSPSDVCTSLASPSTGSPPTEAAKSDSEVEPSRDQHGALNFCIKDLAPALTTEQKDCNAEVSAALDDVSTRASHSRKSTNPVKRQWQPSSPFGATYISPSGKKRVLCTACNKTFCDKGALKIHYSAVHLKEMHKCTVDGCNMMFSSRRSRNRHSANPNPKLHMPQSRRKMPEGATVVDEKSPPSSLSATVAAMAPTLTLGGGAGVLGASEQASLATLSPPLLSDATRLLPKLDPMLRPTMPPHTPPRHPAFYMDPGLALLPSAPKAPRMASPKPDEPEPKVDAVAEDAGAPIPTTAATTAAATATPGRSKRKRCAPTRVAPAAEVYMSDDELMTSHEKADDVMEDRFIKSDEFQKIKDAALRQMDSIGLKEMVREERQCVFPRGDVIGRGWPSYTGESEDIGSPPSEFSEPEDGDMDEEDVDIPVDQENPRRCSACGKHFPNEFVVRAHYQNIHLKRKHTCTIDGCNAAFPSKRSRDRHSSNLNLHRKLLSTSGEADSHVMTSLLSAAPMRSEDFLAGSQLYESGVAFPGRGGNDAVEESVHRSPVAKATVATPPVAREQPSPGNDNNNDEQSTNRNEDEKAESMFEDVRAEIQDGAVVCHVCRQWFRDNLVLKEHFETLHPKEMFHCTVEGCEKIFSTRKSRNRHSQNDNLHRHLATSPLSGAL